MKRNLTSLLIIFLLLALRGYGSERAPVFSMQSERDTVLSSVDSVGGESPSVVMENEQELMPPGAPEVHLRTHVGGYREAGYYYPDDERAAAEMPDSNRNWLHLLQRGKLSLKDTTVQWPRFLRFALGVYNWGDRFFNGFDTTYVVSTGRRWKVRLVTDIWGDTYLLKAARRTPIGIASSPIVHTGIYLQYMAISVGYQVDVGNIIFNRPTNNRKLSFGFSCGLFSAEGSYMENNGGAYLHRFGDYNDGKWINILFPGLTMRTFETDIYFFVNHRRYSQVAAYSFGRIQKKRAGSILLGFSYVDQSIYMNFNTLSEDMYSMLPLEHRQLRYHYYNYNFLVGYGYSWPVRRHLLFNVTIMPAVGWNSSNEVSSKKDSKMFSAGLRGQTSVTYNYGDFFGGFSGKISGQYYYSHSSSLFSSIMQGLITLGVRF